MHGQRTWLHACSALWRTCVCAPVYACPALPRPLQLRLSVLGARTSGFTMLPCSRGEGGGEGQVRGGKDQRPHPGLERGWVGEREPQGGEKGRGYNGACTQSRGEI